MSNILDAATTTTTTIANTSTNNNYNSRSISHGCSSSSIYYCSSSVCDRLCGLVVSVEDYKHRGAGFDSRALLRIFLRE
jgi:hypothetical protein